MKSILIYQHQGSMNHGCEAPAYTISGQIRQVCPEAQITAASYFSEHDARFSFPDIDQFVQNDMWLQRFTFPWLMYQLDKRFFHSRKLQEACMYCKPCYELAKTA